MKKFVSSKLPSFRCSPAILITTDFIIKFDLIFIECLFSLLLVRKVLCLVFMMFTSPEMICRITLTKFLFNFFITFLILVRIYVLYIYVNIYVSKRSVFIPEINSIVCYPLLVPIKLSISFRYMFAIKSSKKVRISNR